MGNFVTAFMRSLYFQSPHCFCHVIENCIFQFNQAHCLFVFLPRHCLQCKQCLGKSTNKLCTASTNNDHEKNKIIHYSGQFTDLLCFWCLTKTMAVNINILTTLQTVAMNRFHIVRFYTWCIVEVQNPAYCCLIEQGSFLPPKSHSSYCEIWRTVRNWIMIRSDHVQLELPFYMIGKSIFHRLW